jgi:hypothetical protein
MLPISAVVRSYFFSGLAMASGFLGFLGAEHRTGACRFSSAAKSGLARHDRPRYG